MHVIYSPARRSFSPPFPICSGYLLVNRAETTYKESQSRWYLFGLQRLLKYEWMFLRPFSPYLDILQVFSITHCGLANGKPWAEGNL